MTLERVIQPVDDTCWASTIAMITGIDVDLFPLLPALAPGGSQKTRQHLGLLPWMRLFDSLGYDVNVRHQRPDIPHIQCYFIHWNTLCVSGHVIAVDDDGTIFDSDPDSLIHGQHVSVLDEYCNITFPHNPFITITERK